MVGPCCNDFAKTKTWYSVSRMTVLRLTHLYTSSTSSTLPAAENEAAAVDEAAAEDDAGTKHEAAAEEAWYSVSRMTVLRLTHLRCRRTLGT